MGSHWSLWRETYTIWNFFYTCEKLNINQYIVTLCDIWNKWVNSDTRIEQFLKLRTKTYILFYRRLLQPCHKFCFKNIYRYRHDDRKFSSCRDYWIWEKFRWLHQNIRRFGEGSRERENENNRCTKCLTFYCETQRSPETADAGLEIIRRILIIIHIRFRSILIYFFFLLQALILEKSMELERLRVQYDSLKKIEMEQLETIEHLSVN